MENTDGQGGEDRIGAYVDNAEQWLDDHPGHRARFRFPYLDEGGKDIEKRIALRAGLQQRGLANAYVTVDNYDWYLDGLASSACAAAT